MRRRSVDMGGEQEPRKPALVISPEAPYPMWGGGALRTAAVLNYLAQSYDIDLVLFREPGANDPVAALPKGLVTRTRVIDLPFHSRGASARLWRNGVRLVRGVPPLVDRFAGFEDEITAFAGDRRYHLGWVEHFWCAPYHAVLAPRCGKTVLDLHNVESVWHERMAHSAGGMTGWAHGRFSHSCQQLETRWLAKYTQVIAASEREALLANGAYYANTIPAPPVVAEPKENVVAFSGNMGYEPNRQAVAWFAREVWPRLRERHPKLQWRLIGKNAEAIEPIVRGVEGIEWTGAVEDALAELARCKVAVVPLRSGSGTRIKILEAWAAGVPVVSTGLGCEGLGATPGAELLVADSAEAFADGIEQLLSSPDLRWRIAECGKTKFYRTFTWEAGWNSLKALGI